MWGEDVDWKNYPNTDWYMENPGATEFSISTAADLAGLAELVNAGNDFADKTVILQNDIVLNVDVLDESGQLNETNKEQFKQWIPIGWNAGKEVDEENEEDELLFFKGTFDGGGHTVSGVYIDNEKIFAYLGLFGCLGKGGVIKNVGVEDSYVERTGRYATVGGVCGKSLGSISNSYNAGSVGGGENALVGGVCGSSSGSIVNSYNLGSVEGTEFGAEIGGVCGKSSGSIINSYNTGSVKGTGMYASAGGVCCESSGLISNSYNTGSVEGGIVP